MAYQIDRYSNVILTVVEDGTVDQTTDLKLIGKNYAGYGEIQNENFLYLLENFSGANEPPRPLSGQIWFDSNNSKLKFYDGGKWRTTGGAEVGGDKPLGLANGDFWWDDSNEQLYVYNGTDYTLIGPQNVGDGFTQMQSQTVVDELDLIHNIIVSYIDSIPIFVISNEEFTLNDSVTVLKSNGFDRIKKGITSRDTKNTSNGVTSTDYRYWGTARNAELLGGLPAEKFINVDQPVFTSLVNFSDNGITIGDSNDLRIYVQNGTEGVIENFTGANSKITFKTTDSFTNPESIFEINQIGLIPSVSSKFDIGTPDFKWRYMYADQFKGVADIATAMRVGSENRPASTTAEPNRIACRDENGNLSANLFIGTATSARYADLAEKYTTDQTHPIGTIMCVAENGAFECRAAESNDYPIGVISKYPAYLMNADSTGQAVGLKGRVPVRVIGPITKGSPIYTYKNGIGSAQVTHSVVGIALETNYDQSEKLVECVLKV